ncbi:MAG: hypothetical protein VXY94_09230 [Planctomycetota bacterium]|nr:hypothetical protein [Planctomycetota bacterium]MEC8560247.1 hypothetical protein [Planctomycetota bacterium]MEC8735011.1 hypothetical protein [Planctomycetota bacterium]MEC9157738.1 hypothetical protein [Planctomycetota bacterium]MEC9232596.1 hypothetical protein [Planctomycetota bacterium]
MDTHGIHPGLAASYEPLARHASSTDDGRAVAFSRVVADRATAGSTSRMRSLVAGNVASGINRGAGFDAPPPRANAAGNLQLYRSPAARMEAATMLEAGRILDTTA